MITQSLADFGRAVFLAGLLYGLGHWRYGVEMRGQPRRTSPHIFAEVVAALLLAAGTELLSAAAGVDTLGENAPSTPLPILFSFGMVTAAMGIGVTTGVMGSAYPPPPRCPCPFPAARMALKAAPRWRSVLFRRVLQRVYLFVSFRYGGTGVHHLSAGCFFAGCALLRGAHAS